MFQILAIELSELKSKLHSIRNDKATEEKYRIDEKKRKLLGQLDDLTRARDIYVEIARYNDQKETYIIREKWATAEQQNAINKIFGHEKDFLNSGDKYVIRQNAEELKGFNDKIWLQNDERFSGIFFSMSMVDDDCFKNTSKLEEIKQTGLDAAKAGNHALVKQVVMSLYNNMKPDCQKMFTRQEDKEHIQFNSGITKTGLK